MPSRFNTRRSPLRDYRSYGNNEYLYEAHARSPVFDALSEGVGGFLAARDAREQAARQAEEDARAQEDRDAATAIRDVEMQSLGIRRGDAPDPRLSGRAPQDMIGLTSGQDGSTQLRGMGTSERQDQRTALESFRQLNDRYYVAEAETPDARARRAAEGEQRSAGLSRGVRQALMRRIQSGDESAVPEALEQGISPTMLKALVPDPEVDPEDPEEKAYKTRRGNLRAEQEFEVGNFRPERPAQEPAPKRTSSADARNYARNALQNALSSKDLLRGGYSADAAYMDAVNALFEQGLGEDQNVLRELRSMAGVEFSETKARQAEAAASNAPRRGSVPMPPPR